MSGICTKPHCHETELLTMVFYLDGTVKVYLCMKHYKEWVEMSEGLMTIWVQQ